MMVVDGVFDVDIVVGDATYILCYCVTFCAVHLVATFVIGVAIHGAMRRVVHCAHVWL